MLRRLGETSVWDVIVVGGGATGIGIAVDAASRGYAVLLLERHDFGKGTSSRSTKLVHGGVRYLEQGNIPLVMEALKERGILRQNAPHLVSDLAFVVPSYDWWEAPFYGLGLKLYDLLAGQYGFGRSRMLSPEETLERLPTLRTEGLRGGVVYYDGQFDDARLLIALARTAAAQGATILNAMEVIGLVRGPDGMIDGVECRDVESGVSRRIAGRVVINAAGPFADAVRRLAEPAASPLLSPSQGAHVVLDGSFLPRDHAILVPHTRDHRVMFAIPWQDHTLVGTTDTPVDEPSVEPRPFEEEIAFILETSARYLQKAPTRADVTSAFAGVRPLVGSVAQRATPALARDHTIHIDSSGLVTVAGGKWTTYRRMAEEAVDRAADLAGLPERPCTTKTLRIHGFHEHPEQLGPLACYGSDNDAIEELARTRPQLAAPLHPRLPYRRAEAVWAAREEMARSVEDVLARRLRGLFLDARAAIEMAPAVASLVGDELGWDAERRAREIEDFRRLAEGYMLA
jgi:glycerol-3-phosphate dehydrogenase